MRKWLPPEDRFRLLLLTWPYGCTWIDRVFQLVQQEALEEYGNVYVRQVPETSFEAFLVRTQPLEEALAAVERRYRAVAAAAPDHIEAWLEAWQSVSEDLARAGIVLVELAREWKERLLSLEPRLGDGTLGDRANRLEDVLVRLQHVRRQPDFEAAWQVLWAAKHIAAVWGTHDLWSAFVNSTILERDRAIANVGEWLERLYAIYTEALTLSRTADVPARIALLDSYPGGAKQMASVGAETLRIMGALLERLHNDPFLTYHPTPQRRERSWARRYQVRLWRPAVVKRLAAVGVPKSCHGELLICVGLDPYVVRSKLSRRRD